MDKKRLAETLASIRECIDSFSEKRKPEREVWTCNQFLSNLSVQFDAAEMTSVPVGQDPPDVLFRDARFEVTEVLDPGRERHREYKELYERIEQSGDTSLIAREIDFKELFPPEIGEMVLGRACEKSGRKNYPPAARATIDLLVYVDLLEHSPRRGLLPDAATFAPLGWRSVSALISWASLVFYAAPDAPQFLRERVGQFICLRE